MLNESKYIDSELRYLNEYITRELAYRDSSIDRPCTICHKAMESGTVIPFFNGILYVHLDCATKFIEHISVELLDTFEPLSTSYTIISASLDISIEESINSSINHIGRGLVESLLSRRHVNSKFSDLHVSNIPGISSLTQRIIVEARMQHGCLFCGTGRRMIMPPLKWSAWANDDMMLESPHVAKEESLVITGDQQYIFHKSCLNEALVGLQKIVK